mmetsp:Transcript_6147/g.11009  ORF Transcript_6147/g.11009 Transcript_6147/m.11009 type:complete len:104 (+) Transcript_6147:323-634(+)
MASSKQADKKTPGKLQAGEGVEKQSDMGKKTKDFRPFEDWNEANEAKINEMCGITGDLLKASLFTCGKCNSNKTTSTQKQANQTDDRMKVFVLCLNCGERWTC